MLLRKMPGSDILSQVQELDYLRPEAGWRCLQNLFLSRPLPNDRVRESSWPPAPGQPAWRREPHFHLRPAFPECRFIDKEYR
ncbi:MAG: hypothetical protein OP8BY_1006 [Candidatus Saccharicenans subterraneus]|uniref:Uncharacterized protein n=1 Tax=Candidatus Saccharicenans subterraneus TaxID=2508984 RepID=A0A3E2BQS3_9BACT|nr:MAG: hypothetical protein OP8BY_1006 [Candidatus Saccharicenans subterraneum]